MRMKEVSASKQSKIIKYAEINAKKSFDMIDKIDPEKFVLIKESLKNR